MFTDTIGHLSHRHARDTSLVLVSRGPLAEITPFMERMGWSIPWYSSLGSDFNDDMGAGDGFGLNDFLRDADEVYRTYFTTGRGVERLGSHGTLLDLTPFGRQETWEDSPAGRPTLRDRNAVAVEDPDADASPMKMHANQLTVSLA